MKDLILPDPLAEHYELVSCLKYSEQASTCLIAVRSSGKTVLLKTASDPLLSKSLLQEKMVLEMIHQTDSPFAASFPRPILLEWYGETCFYIRSYIEGKSLEELCESNYERPGFVEPTALEYLIELTEILHFMHTLTPSLLHRDIKPQNVIVDSFGKCHFIDLGISRFLNSSKTSDTLVMGTRLTAPPEQFGYQQTDLRSDIYSLGILLLYCITGEYKPENAVLMELSEPVRQIVTKATIRPRQTISDHGGTASEPSESPVPFCLFFPTYSNCSSPFSKTQPFPPALFPSLSFHGRRRTCGRLETLRENFPSGDDFPEGR